MSSDRIDKFLYPFRKYLFYYKNGFYHLPLLTNSPESIIQSLAKMPFVQHAEQKQLIVSDTPFVQARIYYQEIEEGLWLQYAESKYKSNVQFNRIVDKRLPSDYYLLSLEESAWDGKNASRLVLFDDVTYSKPSWLLFKPNAINTNCYFKGSQVTSFSMYFNKKWVDEVLFKKPEFLTSNLRSFFESETKYLLWPDSTGESSLLDQPFRAVFETKEKMETTDLNQFKDVARNFISGFIRSYEARNDNSLLLEISEMNMKKIDKAEKILMKNIQAPFMGIEELARQSGIAPTQLKSIFKLIYGQTVFQYFRQKQMEYAYSLLRKKSNTVKDIALTYGYENPGKFSAAFKKHFGVLPSELR